METSVDLGALGQLSVFPDETAKALFRRKAGRPIELGIPLLSAVPRPGRSAPGIFPGDVIEVFGESGSGKTEVLLHAVAHIVLPSPPESPRDVIYFDHECRLDLARLELLLRHRLDTLASPDVSTAQKLLLYLKKRTPNFVLPCCVLILLVRAVQ